jgi:hypothetical protein
VGPVALQRQVETLRTSVRQSPGFHYLILSDHVCSTSPFAGRRAGQTPNTWSMEMTELKQVRVRVGKLNAHVDEGIAPLIKEI